MFFKRPIISFLSAFIVGIIVANINIPTLFKLLISFIFISILFILFFQKKLTIKIFLIILLFSILGFFRFKIVEKVFDDYDKKILSLEKGNKIFSGKVINIGKTTNSDYILIDNVILNGLELGRCRCYLNKEINVSDIKIGNLVKINGGISIIKDPTNEGEFNQKNYYRSQDIGFITFGKEIEIANKDYNKILQGIYDSKQLIKKQIHLIFNYKDAGLFSAMLTGDKSTINKQQKKNFSDNGIAHILAISGLHLSILGLFLFEILRKKFSVIVSSSIVSIFILFYGIFIDAGPSSLRAIIMLYIRFLSLSIGRTYDSKNTLFILCIVFLIINPYLLYNAGFQFSYLAIYALNTDVIIYRKKYQYKDKCIKIPSVIILTMYLFPLTIYHYFTYPLYSILINLIVIPLMAFVLGFGIAGVLVSFIFLIVGEIIVVPVHYIFCLYDFLCDLATKLPYHILWLGRPTLYELLFYYVSLSLIIYAINESANIKNKLNNNLSLNNKNRYYSIFNFRFRIVLCICLLIFSVIIIGVRKRSDFRLTFLDIGQGDGIVVESGNLFLTIDGGSSSNTSNGEYLLVPHLKSRAIKDIEYAFISHSDSDHTNGIIYLLTNEYEINIKNIVLPINAKTSSSYTKLKALASDRGAKVIYFGKDDKLILNSGNNEILIDILSPDFGHIKKDDVNNNSLVFRMNYKNKSALFTGDVGKSGIYNMIADKKICEKLKVNVLKVPHHGSKNSNVPEFIENIKPDYSIFSYSATNTYGHPHQVTVDTVANSGSKILKTAETGQIDIYFNNDIYEKTFKN